MFNKIASNLRNSKKDRNGFFSYLLCGLVIASSFFQMPCALGGSVSATFEPTDELSTGRTTVNALVFSQAGINQDKNVDTRSDFDTAALFEDIEISVLNHRFLPTFGVQDIDRPRENRFVSSTTPDAFTESIASAAVRFQSDQSQLSISGTVSTLQPIPNAPTDLTGEIDQTPVNSDEGSTLVGIGMEPVPAPSPPQNAASWGDWPTELRAGTFKYAPKIVDTSLQTSSQINEVAAVVFIAEDSRFNRNLWELTILSMGSPTDPADLVIEFKSQDILNLDDALVEKQVQEAFSVNDGVATLNNHTLFETTYEVTDGTVFNEIIGTVVTPVPELDPFKCYLGRQFPPFTEDNPRLPFPTKAKVTLNDQFASRKTDVRFLKGLCNPAGKDAPVDTARTDHLSCYTITDAPGQAPFFSPRRVTFETENFGEDTVRLGHAFELCVSASKNGEGEIAGPAFKCYNARSAQRNFPDITLDDQFFTDEPAQIRRLSRLCTPASQDNELVLPLEVPEAFDHLACYDIDRRILHPFIKVDLLDRFIEDAVDQDITFTTALKHRFCEPARKLSVEDRFFAAPE